MGAIAEDIHVCLSSHVMRCSGRPRAHRAGTRGRTAFVPREQHRGLVQIDKHERAAAQRHPGRHPPIAEVLEDLELIRAHALRLPHVQEREAADTPRRLLAMCAPHHQHQRETHEQDCTQGQQGGVSSHGAPSFLSVRTVRLSHEANPSHPTGRVGPRLLA